MSVERGNASINNTITLRIKFQYAQTSDYFNPYAISKVEILDEDGVTVLETITGGNIIQDSTGNYHVVASAITVAKTIYDKWYFTPSLGATEITKTNICVVFSVFPSVDDAYATEEDIERLLKSMTFNADSKLTSADLNVLLIEKTAYINSRIAVKYDIPVEDIEMLKVLRIVCKLLTGAEVLRTVKEAIGMDGEEKDIVSKWEKHAESMLDKIIYGTLVFADADLNYTSNFRQTGTVDKSGKDIEPQMTMDMEF